MHEVSAKIHSSPLLVEWMGASQWRHTQRRGLCDPHGPGVQHPQSAGEDPRAGAGEKVPGAGEEDPVGAGDGREARHPALEADERGRGVDEDGAERSITEKKV